MIVPNNRAQYPIAFANNHIYLRLLRSGDVNRLVEQRLRVRGWESGEQRASESPGGAVLLSCVFQSQVRGGMIVAARGTHPTPSLSAAATAAAGGGLSAAAFVASGSGSGPPCKKYKSIENKV